MECTRISSRPRISSISESKSTDIKYGRCELDCHADNIVAGWNYVILGYTGQVCDVSPYREDDEPAKDVPVVQVAAAWQSQHTGQTYILVFNEAFGCETLWITHWLIRTSFATTGLSYRTIQRQCFPSQSKLKIWGFKWNSWWMVPSSMQKLTRQQRRNYTYVWWFSWHLNTFRIFAESNLQCEKWLWKRNFGCGNFLFLLNQLIGRFVQCKQFRSLARIRYFEIIQLIREECDPSTKLRGEGEFEELFEVVGNEGRKKLKEIFCRRPEKLTRSHWKGFFFEKLGGCER